MIENAPRQVALVVLVSLIALLCLFGKDTNYGLDLSGGTQLVYELDLEQAVEDYPDTPPDEILRETLVIVADRIDPTGTLDAGIQQRGDRQFVVELPDVGRTEAEVIKGQIQNLGRLEMRVLADGDYDKEGVTFDLAEEQRRLQDWLNRDDHRAMVVEDPRSIVQYNTLPAAQGGPQSPHLHWYPRKVEPSYKDPEVWDRPYTQFNPDVVPVYDRQQYLAGPPEDWEGDEPPYLLELFPINMHEVHFTGEQMDAGGVRPTTGDDGLPAIAYALQGEYATSYAEWSDEYTGKASAIILNGFVRSAPVFQGRIPGRGIIHGDFTQQEALDLAKVIKTGSLKIKPQLISDVSIGATLGRAAIRRGGISIAAGGVLVLLFILLYYRLAGLVAFSAVVMNIVLILGVVKFIEATITLPGIAGLVLTMGMAVDANILIYERIREELTKGKNLLQAVRAGFDRAMVTILDANITTFIAGVVLYNVGVGPVRGFAVTLMVGIATTLFTAYFVSRLAFHYLLAGKVVQDFRVANWFGNLRFDFIGFRRVAFTASLLLIVAGLIYTFAVPAYRKFGLDFTGGASLELVLREPMRAPELRERLAASPEFVEEFPDPQINPLDPNERGAARHFNLKLKLSSAVREQLARERAQAEAQGLEYEPPYKEQLRDILDDVLVSEAFTEITKAPDPTEPISYAVATVHLSAPVRLADVTGGLVQVVGPRAEARAPGDPDAETTADVQLEFPVQTDATETEIRDTIMEALAGLETADGEPIELSNPIPNAQDIGPRMVGELQTAALGALVISIFLIVMYIRIRFHEYKYSLAAVAALVHDVAVTYIVVVLFNSLGLVSAEIDLAMIAAFLTIIGYSINDTIVIFDRVRENVSDQERLGDTKETFAQLLNRSINATLSRTILTSGTTMFVVLAQFLVNHGSGSGLEGFSFALIIGILTGTYSTIFIASPVVLWLKNREGADAGTRGGRPEADREAREQVTVQSPA